MAANNEIGSIQPVKKIGDFLHYKRWGKVSNPEDKEEFENLSHLLNSEVTIETLRRLHFHVDAVQAFGKVHLDKWFSFGIDSSAISAHKLGALQGVGAFFYGVVESLSPLFWEVLKKKIDVQVLKTYPVLLVLVLLHKTFYLRIGGLK